MEPGALLPRNNFVSSVPLHFDFSSISFVQSSIARRLLLNKESGLASQTLNAADLIPCPLPRQQQQQEEIKMEVCPCPLSDQQHQQQEIRIERHSCELCDRLRGITAQMLKAPVEKSHKNMKRRGRPNIGQKAKVTVKHVGEFFMLLRRQLGLGFQETVFNSPKLLTALACGVSSNTVTRTMKTSALLEECNWKASAGKKNWQMTTLKKFGQEWSVVVRNFVNTVLEEEGRLTVTELHSRLRYAYADFPMCSTTLQYFLSALGFPHKRKYNKVFIIPERKIVTMSESESEHDDDDDDDDEYE
ncbi:hypothetical protein Y032_0286g1376 [Ancylostoma ceylanicum]|uniref:Uncharacterized protein n=1 Tax=Ancylostoma ceylanicum TaxID=53326 RepID=A0A016S6Q9_9BILA|nr:hypothetical protein Y032_0286g1376 [Ancylostoma ceylanicum]